MCREAFSVYRLVPLVLLGAVTSAGHAQTDVPRGGAVITPGAGSSQVVVEVKNKTGKDAYDISVSIFRDDGGAVPDITGQDIVQNDGQAEDDDHVDDDGDGKLGAGETDSTDGSPGKTCKSIMDDSGAVENGKVAKVTIDFNGPIPEGAKIRIKFSERIGDKHYDMCMATPMNDGGVAFGIVETGPAQMGFEVVNLGSASLDHLSIPTHFTPVRVLDARLDGLFSDRIIIVDDDSVEIYDIGLHPGEALEMGLIFERPIELVPDQGQLPMFGTFEACPADFNGDGQINTLDVLAFLNAWNTGCG
ncbi:MAG: hypothetical protein IT431_02900 [Phycisphaerales bacterium]|nr:hypothetical protein [Phycisphaerales bacterium]